MLNGAKKNLQAVVHSQDYFKGKILTADTNYHSHNNLEKCFDEKLDAYIPDIKFRKRDSKFDTQKRHQSQKQKPFKLEDFKHDQANNQYICPYGKRLILKVKSVIANRVIYKKYLSNEADCRDCSLKHRCIRGKKGNRRQLDIPIGITENNYLKAMVAKVDSDKGRRIYPQRIAIVEPVFANIRTHKQMNRFTLKGKIKVDIQWLLYCMVHNMGKIIRFSPV